MKNGIFIKLFLYGFISLTLTLTSCGGGGGGTPPNNTRVGQVRQVYGVNGSMAVLRTISITPNNPLGINSGTPLQFSARGYYSDNSVQDLTTMVAWTSSDKSIASISNASESKGQALTISRGYCSISATIGGISGSTIIGVN
jgi:hypothetical protein